MYAHCGCGSGFDGQNYTRATERVRTRSPASAACPHGTFYCAELYLEGNIWDMLENLQREFLFNVSSYLDTLLIYSCGLHARICTTLQPSLESFRT